LTRFELGRRPPSKGVAYNEFRLVQAASRLHESRFRVETRLDPRRGQNGSSVLDCPNRRTAWQACGARARRGGPPELVAGRAEHGDRRMARSTARNRCSLNVTQVMARGRWRRREMLRAGVVTRDSRLRDTKKETRSAIAKDRCPVTGHFETVWNRPIRALGTSSGNAAITSGMVGIKRWRSRRSRGASPRWL